ncbi:MAG: sugar ABC transporter substrate-binding protein [Anaerolineae bacterium]|nr:sugar ABC transporter substrate-binding protein [Anaerolineae bacterium]
MIGILLVLLTTSISLSSVIAAQDSKKICFAFVDLETEFWVAGHKAIVETLTAQGIEVIEVNGNQDANKQLEQVKDCIVQGVDGIILIPQDGEEAVAVVKEAQEADIPIAVFNRPPTDTSKGIVVVADNANIAAQAVEYMAQKAISRFEITGQKINPLIMVGDLGDPNAVGRKEGFYSVINRYPDIFNTPIEVATEWDAKTGLANLESAIAANPSVDFLFTSSDFLFPVIRSVLEPKGMWVKAGQKGHVIMGGLDGDATACQLIQDGYVDTTGVQDLYNEATLTLDAITGAIANGETQPNQVLPDPGFALTSASIIFEPTRMWGCKLLAEGFLKK